MAKTFDTNERMMRILQAQPDQIQEIDRILMGRKPPDKEGQTKTAMATIGEAAKYLSCSRATIYRLVAAGKLRCTHLLNRSPRIHRSDLQRIATGEEV